MMKKTLTAVAVASLAVGSALAACGGNDDPVAPAVVIPATPFVVKLIGFNDYHGTLESPGTFGLNTSVPAANRPPVGGGTGALRLLSIDMPNRSSSNSSRSPRGGQVFDATGRLLGLALAGPPGSPDRLVTASALPEARGHALAPQAPRDADARYGMDRIFEASLKTALQVIALP